ncbi:hypothetical protein EST38_g12378 [Candolleomyces aberdarensis]|uniref:Uncharacterized protein n=1 Tax=Candolleomyces aberdarensis TaxID=2316362 RepID=A0A4Q2D552_9AGAR|nr:hypothetical protein EST38_g12378 [Candolleomyces aberdarensis]
MDSASVAPLVELARALQGVKYLIAASIVLFVADFLDTLTLEASFNYKGH